MKVLLIEDDHQLHKAIKTYLEIKHFDVRSSYDGQGAIFLIDSNEYDTYIIDVNLPKVNGLDIVKYIRQKDLTTPIIMITASLEVENLLTAFKNGCNEYIKKPFHLKELGLRLDNLLINENEDIISVNENIHYNKKHDELFINSKQCSLRKKEKRLLKILFENINHTVRSEQIYDYVWENEIKESYPIRQLVNELRNKLPDGKTYIKTEVGIGYKLEI